MTTNENNWEKMMSGLSGLSLLTLGIKNFKHPAWLTGVAIVAGGYLLYKAVEDFLPEREAMEDYLEDPLFAREEADFI